MRLHPKSKTGKIYNVLSCLPSIFLKENIVRLLFPTALLIVISCIGVLDTKKGFAHSDLRPSFLHKRCSILRHQIGKRGLVDAEDSFRAITRRWLVRHLFIIKIDMFLANTFVSSFLDTNAKSAASPRSAKPSA